METVWVFPRVVVVGAGGGGGEVGGGGGGCSGGGVPPHVFRAHHLLRRGDVTMIVKMR